MAAAASASADDYYDLPSRLLEEGQQATPPPATVARPPPGPSRRRGRRIPAWACAVRVDLAQVCSITMCVLIVVFLAAPLAVQYRNRGDAFICVFLFVMSAAFPVIGYVITAELSEEET